MKVCVYADCVVCVTPFWSVPVTHTSVGSTVEIEDEDDDDADVSVVSAATKDARNNRMIW